MKEGHQPFFFFSSGSFNMHYRCHCCKIQCKRGDPSLIRANGNIYHKQCFRCHVSKTSVPCISEAISGC